MVDTSTHSGPRRGKPKGPPRLGVFMRLLPDQKRDLQILQGILEGRPPINGLLEEAVHQYIARKLEDPRIREEYERRSQPALTVISPPRRHSADAG